MTNVTDMPPMKDPIETVSSNRALTNFSKIDSNMMYQYELVWVDDIGMDDLIGSCFLVSSAFDSDSICWKIAALSFENKNN
jgi:hypothetical protein